MSRSKLAFVISALLLMAALPAAASARPALIKGEEIGYFGSATITHTVDVFVYSKLGPAAGNRVTVCLAGQCQTAHGHNARLDWYAAAFRTRGFRMGDMVTFTVVASDGGRRSRVSVRRDLLCMHNDGSTPQH